MDACHCEGRCFVNEGLNADDQHNGYGLGVLGLKKERKKTLKSIKLTANCYELLSIIKGE